MTKRTFLSKSMSKGSHWLHGDTARSGKGAKPSRLFKSRPGGGRKNRYTRARKR